MARLVRKPSSLRPVFLPVALSVLLLAGPAASPALAYFDPGTGSMVLQLLMGGMAGALVLGRFYTRRIGNWFRQTVLRRPAK